MNKRTLSHSIIVLALLICTAGAASDLASIQDEQVVKNLTTLLKSSGKDIGGALLGSTVRITVWTLVFSILGVVFGLAAWLNAHKRKHLEAPWNVYRYFKWLWILVFIGCFTFFGGCSGFWFGAASSAKKAIVEDHLVNKMVANIVCAFAMSTTDYELTGGESAAEIEDRGDRGHVSTCDIVARHRSAKALSCLFRFIRLRIR